MLWAFEWHILKKSFFFFCLVPPIIAFWSHFKVSSLWIENNSSHLIISEEIKYRRNFVIIRTQRKRKPALWSGSSVPWREALCVAVLPFPSWTAVKGHSVSKQQRWGLDCQVLQQETEWGHFSPGYDVFVCQVPLLTGLLVSHWQVAESQLPGPLSFYENSLFSS